MTIAPDKIGELCAKYDKDGNGKYSLDEVRSIVADLDKEKAGKKAYKGAAIGLFIIVVLSLVAMFGVSFAAGHALKDSKLEQSAEGTAVMKSTSGAPVTVSVSEENEGWFDIPLLDVTSLATLQTFTAFVDMTADG